MSEEKREEKQYEIQNIVEESVEREVRTAMRNINMCRCEKCFRDVCAIVLNQLPPKYVTTLKGELLARADTMDEQEGIELTMMIAKACRIVSQSPLHD